MTYDDLSTFDIKSFVWAQNYRMLLSTPTTSHDVDGARKVRCVPINFTSGDSMLRVIITVPLHLISNLCEQEGYTQEHLNLSFSVLFRLQLWFALEAFAALTSGSIT